MAEAKVRKPYLVKVAEAEPTEVPILASLLVRPTRTTDDVQPAKGNSYGGSAALRTMHKGHRRKTSPTQKG